MIKLAKIKETIEFVKKNLQDNQSFLSEYEEMASKWEEDKKQQAEIRAAKNAENSDGAALEEGAKQTGKGKKGKKNKK